MVYTSGTTSRPKGVMLTHGTFLSTLEVAEQLIPPRHHRLVGILPLSHLFEQAVVLFYGAMLGSEIVYVRSLNPRTLFGAIRELRATTMVVTPQVLQLFWTGLMREVDGQGRRGAFERARRFARHLPMPLRRRAIPRPARTARRCADAVRLRGSLPATSTATGLGGHRHRGRAGLWGDRGGAGGLQHGARSPSRRRRSHHPAGAHPLADHDNEILIAGPTVSPGYWQDDAATAAAYGEDGWYRTGDIGRFDAGGRLLLVGRKRNVIVLPNGLNVFPEDIENLLTDQGLEQAVVIETTPGRIEAIVMPPGTTPILAPGRGGQSPRTPAEQRAVRLTIDDVVAKVEQPTGRAPAHRCLADVARARLPTYASAEDPARSDPRVGQCRCAAASSGRGLKCRGPAWALGHVTRVTKERHHPHRPMRMRSIYSPKEISGRS